MSPDELMRKTAAAVEAGRMSAAAGERLLGFIAGQSAGFPPPSEATWHRRVRELRSLGLPAPARPELFRFSEPVGSVRERRRVCKR